MDPAPHRKTVRRFNEPGHAHLLTFSCVGRRPLLTDERPCELLSRAIDAALQRHSVDLVAFVYMPEHVHLLVFPRSPAARIERVLWAIKRPSSFRIKEHLIAGSNPLAEELVVRERPGVSCFRFWQEGGGHDRNLVRRDTVRAAAEYIHANPVRRELCATESEWRWSSWKHYHRPTDPADPALPTVHGWPG